MPEATGYLSGNAATEKKGVQKAGLPFIWIKKTFSALH